MPDVLRRVGRYDLLEVIGRGGAAVVYLAHQRDLQRHVALKELAPFHAADESFAQRFVEESRLAGSMSHANVVTVHEFFEDAGVPYIAMEHLPYGSLRHYVGELTLPQIAGVLEGVLAGLSHGEAHGIVHRDLKPENLLVAADGRVKIADFGVARAYNNAVTRNVVTAAGTTIGTPAYMSPEQALGAEPGPSTDLYSLGIVAWEMLSGHVPFAETETPVAVLYRHVHEPIPPVRSVAPDVDPEIERWLERMLAKAPEDRFQGADAAWVALEDVVLDLAGPRWRREARLPVGPSRVAERTLTPAPFEERVRGVTPVTHEADTPPPSPDPARVHTPREESSESPPTVAPRRRRPARHTTMFRLARRHEGWEAPDEEPAAERFNRRLALGGILLAMVIAAVIGVVVADPGSAPVHKPVRTGETAAQITAANAQLTTAMNDLAKARNGDLGEFLNATTPAAQSNAAARLQSAYTLSAKQVSGLVGKSPQAATLQRTLSTIATAYGSLAAAAQGNRARAYGQARGAIETGERQLQTEVGKL